MYANFAIAFIGVFFHKTFLRADLLEECNIVNGAHVGFYTIVIVFRNK